MTEYCPLRSNVIVISIIHDHNNHVKNLNKCAGQRQPCPASVPTEVYT